MKEISPLLKIFIILSYYENNYRKLQQKDHFQGFQKMSKFEEKTELPHLSKFLTNLIFFRIDFFSQVLVFLINFASIIIYILWKQNKLLVFLALYSKYNIPVKNILFSRMHPMQLNLSFLFVIPS